MNISIYYIIKIITISECNFITLCKRFLSKTSEAVTRGVLLKKVFLEIS